MDLGRTRDVETFFDEPIRGRMVWRIPLFAAYFSSIRGRRELEDRWPDVERRMDALATDTRFREELGLSVRECVNRLRSLLSGPQETDIGPGEPQAVSLRDAIQAGLDFLGPDALADVRESLPDLDRELGAWISVEPELASTVYTPYAPAHHWWHTRKEGSS